MKNWKLRMMIKAQLEEEGIPVVDYENIDLLETCDGVDYNLQEKCSIIVIDLLEYGYTLKRLCTLKKKAGSARFILLKGASGISVERLLEEGFSHILKRPFTIDNLVSEVKHVLDKSPW
jgi:DNA-binding response OmpR family regulator